MSLSTSGRDRDIPTHLYSRSSHEQRGLALLCVSVVNHLRVLRATHCLSSDLQYPLHRLKEVVDM